MVTRARHQAEEFSRLLRGLGAEPVEMPTIAIEPPETWDEVDAAIGRLDGYDFVAFTSANAVGAFCGRMGVLGASLGAVRVAAVGPGTAEALAQRGLRVDVVAEESRGEGLFEALSAGGVAGRRFLLPRAEEGREVLPDALRGAGGIVDVVPVYRTVAVSNVDLGPLRRGEIDVLTFASPSAVVHFARSAPNAMDAAGSALVAVIGPVTREACERVGLRVDIQPARYTLEALAEAIGDHYLRRG